MDSNNAFPLGAEEAKAQLREASSHLDPGAWAVRHKWQLLGLAFAGGFVAARLPRSGAAFLRQTAPLLLTAMQRRQGG